MFISEAVVEKSLEYFGLIGKGIHVRKVISIFEKGDICNPERIELKNNLLVHLIESKNLVTNFVVEIKNPCKYCEGRGFDIQLYKTEYVTCKLKVTIQDGKTIYTGCNGTGHKISECKTCRGTGKFGENPCPTCFDPKTKNGRGTFVHWKTSKPNSEIKCLTCMGEGKVKKISKRDTQIKQVNICQKCSGSGINNHLGSPVINQTTAEILKSLLPK